MILRNSQERMSDLPKHVHGSVIAGSQEITFGSIDKMSLSHSIQRRRTRDETALHLPAPLHPSTYPLPSLWLLTPLWGWREKEKGHSRSGGAGTVSPARGFLRRGGWVFKHRLCRGDPSRPHRSPGRWFSALRQPAFQTPLTWPTPRASRNAECGHPGDLQSHR